MLQKVRKLAWSIVLLARRIRFHLLFKNLPADGEFCNSKRIALRHMPPAKESASDFLVFIRSGGTYALVCDSEDRNFDIALNLYAGDPSDTSCGYDYLIAGGLNKYKAAFQFLNPELLEKYGGFMFLDDDLEITGSQLSGFLQYCSDNQLSLAQPSLSPDSWYSHDHTVNASSSGWRTASLVEVMCPWFSAEALKAVLPTFDLSYSTWGLDYLWPRLLAHPPLVVDAFTIRHTRPVSANSAFYRYMSRIGISPDRELEKLKNLPLDRLG